VHSGLRAGYVADPQPRPLGAGMEMAGHRRDGTTFAAEISLSAIDADQGILGAERLYGYPARQCLRTQAGQVFRLRRGGQRHRRVLAVSQRARARRHFDHAAGDALNWRKSSWKERQ
jgi:hypothetical protein